MTKMMMKRNGTQTNGANPKGKNAEEPAKEKAIAETARIPTTTARTRPMATVFGGGLRGTGGGNHPAGGGGGWGPPPQWAGPLLKVPALSPATLLVLPGRGAECSGLPPASPRRHP